MTTTKDSIQQLGRDWANAEVRGDVAALDAMTTDDFTLVGPLGFVLDKQQWLRRYQGGGLVTQQLSWEEAQVRDYGSAAVSVGVHDQKAEYNGQPADGRFRITHVFVHDGDRWLLAGVHLSPIGGPPPFAKRDTTQSPR